MFQLLVLVFSLVSLNCHGFGWGKKHQIKPGVQLYVNNYDNIIGGFPTLYKNKTSDEVRYLNECSMNITKEYNKKYMNLKEEEDLVTTNIDNDDDPIWNYFEKKKQALHYIYSQIESIVNEKRNKLNNKIDYIINQIAKSKKASAVISNVRLLYIDKELDITEQLIDKLNKNYESEKYQLICTIE